MYSSLAGVPSAKFARRVRDLIGQACPPHVSLLTTVSGTVELYILLYTAVLTTICCFFVYDFFFHKKENFFFSFLRLSVCVSMCARVCVCVCVCVSIKLHITAQSGLVILVILCHSH